MVIETLLPLIVVIIGIVSFLYLLVLFVFSMLYVEQEADEEHDSVTFVCPTIASERIQDSLYEVIDHHRATFPDMEFTLVVDEGSDLQDDLQSRNDVTCVVVPDDYECESTAKGRAQQYYIDNYVDRDEWYVFVDDDSKVLDRTFLREIPLYEEKGYVAANGMLIPRMGRSFVAFVIDHMRTFYDMFLYRATTGTLGRPYAGLHGEFLVVRGSILQDVGFKHDTIVEDFAFSDELVRRGERTWFSATTVSILSPHSMCDFLKQRRRWFRGKALWYPKASNAVRAVSLAVDMVWLMGLFGGWLVGAGWFLLATQLSPLLIVPGAIAAIVFSMVYVVGVLRASRRRSWLLLPMVLFIPLYATIEHVAAYYALLTKTDGFEVIDK